MDLSSPPLSYPALVTLADQLLDECGEDVEVLSERLDGLSPTVRDDLLVSDLLNAFQTFYYFFRVLPEDLRMERLMLQPASALLDGVVIDEIELLDIIFVIMEKEPVMIVTDGEQVLASFSGKTAYHESLSYINSTL